MQIDCRAVKLIKQHIYRQDKETHPWIQYRDAMQIRSKTKDGPQLYTIYKIPFYRLSSSRPRALLEFIPAFPVGFPRSFLPSASVTPRNSNFRLPSLATVRIFCVWGIPFALDARASHIWHVARAEGARIFNAPSTFGVRLLQKFNQQEPANSKTSEFRKRKMLQRHMNLRFLGFLQNEKNLLNLKFKKRKNLKEIKIPDIKFNKTVI